MISVNNPNKTFIEVLGIHGTFQVPNSDYIVKYFSTFANNREENSGYAELLKELKPMRERVKSGQIKDIGSLLQRDLNDFRVAKELVPYLMGGTGNNIAFFPAILGVLIPKEFLTSEEAIYPEHSLEDNKTNSNLSYEEKWVLEIIKDNQTGNQTPLGKLKIDTYRTDIIVLDGQHRANAFRVVNGTFTDKNNGMYEPFYEGVDSLKDFKADLPITLIWFESTEKALIEPNFISRRLFVDVNNTARKVSKSRTILLNDYDPSSVLARFFYSNLAQNSSFNSNEFSLLHSGFDEDIEQTGISPHIFSLTSPDIIHYINEWVYFTSNVNEQLDRYKVKKEPTLKSDTSKCAKLLPVLRKNITVPQNEYGEQEKRLNIEFEKQYKEEFNTNISHVYSRLFNDLKLLKKHFEACQEMEVRRNTKWVAPLQKDVWDKVFCGGEGLYYSYKNLEKQTKKNNSGANSQKTKDLLSVINEIEKEFSTYRKALIDGPEEKRVNDAFKSFRTKAFQVGYFVAFFDYLMKNYDEINRNTIDEALDYFIKRINRISEVGWIYILTDLRKELIRGTDPKSWPAYHKVILRIIQEGDNYYNVEKHNSPEVNVFYSFLYDKLNGWAESSGYFLRDIDYKSIDSLVDGWIDFSRIKVVELFKSCDLEVMEGIDWNEFGKDYLKRVLENNRR